MATVALVMTYPYEAFSGGEQAYVGALRRFLVSRGHHVDTIISDVSRGRANPIVSLSRAGRGRVVVRRALPVGQGRFLSYDGALIGRSLLSMVGRRRPGPERTSVAEGEWLRRRLDGGKYDAVMLMWDACAMVPPLAQTNVVALPGFFSNRDFDLGAAPIDTVSADDARALARYDRVGLNNRWEMRALRARRDRDGVIYVGMGFAPRQPAAPADQPIILFVGADTAPNRRSLRWFVDHVWPLVAARHPAARFHIVGGAGPAVGALPSTVTALGRVASLDDVYAAAQVVVTPIVSGSAGVKTKVAEALAHAKPLVTTSLGVDPGDPDQMRDDVDVVDEPEHFAAAVNALLGDAGLRQKRTIASQEAFQRLFSDEAAYGDLMRELSL